jgi:hypothetical protein
VYNPEQQQAKTASAPQIRKRKFDANKSYESMGSNEDDQPHYNFDSDGEPPTD